MSADSPVPREVLEWVASLRLPSDVDRRLQHLMDHNTNGLLTVGEREELEIIVAVSESISPLRARALHLLGRKPE